MEIKAWNALKREAKNKKKIEEKEEETQL